MIEELDEVEVKLTEADYQLLCMAARIDGKTPMQFAHDATVSALQKLGYL